LIAASLARFVDFIQRHAALVVITVLLVSGASGFYAARDLKVDTDINHMLPSNVGWRQNEFALDEAFPQNVDLLVVVIDGQTGDLADRAASDLAARMKARPDLFTYVRRPDSGEFFDRNGPLFLSAAELQNISDKIVEAQPLIGTLARDPSLRGLFDTLEVFVKGAERDNDQGAIERLDPTLAAIGNAVQAVLDGGSDPVSWQRLMTGLSSDSREQRRFILTRPVLDFNELQPGIHASAELRRLASELNIDPQHGLRMRLTGPVALNDEQFATLERGAVGSTILSLVTVCLILFMAVRSVKLVLAMLVTICAGLALNAGFAALAIGSLNLISIAFGVLFIGLGDDFGNQFSVLYRDQRHRVGSLSGALEGAAARMGPSILLAGAATAIGFLAFVPTSYVGVRELGWIAGFGMIIAVVLNLTLLPALLTLLRPPAEPEPVGFRWGPPVDRFLMRRRPWVIAGSGVLAAACIALLPGLRFDFDPLNLKDPKAESVVTARDLMNDPMTTPYTAQTIVPSLRDAEALAEKLSKLPEVSQVITAASFIPADQEPKLAILADLRLLIGPTLSPEATLPEPSDDEVLAAMAKLRGALQPVAAREAETIGSQSAALRLANALDGAASRGAAIIPALQRDLMTGLEQRLDTLRLVITAEPVTLDTLPAELRDTWITPDGRARVEIFPQNSARDNDALRRFVAAVRTIAPDVTGLPVTIQEAGRLISSAFVEAGIIAIVAITLLLAIVLRRARDVALIILPLLLAAALTLAVMIVIGKPLNYANIIALPLLFGIGVAFNIYFVMNWRAGITDHLQSSTARAVVFSALTTMAAFGSLALSPDPSTSEMGWLLTVSLTVALLCALFVLPALLGPAPPAAAQPAAPAMPPPSASEPPSGLRRSGEVSQFTRRDVSDADGDLEEMPRRRAAGRGRGG
jgi:hopanoid biosynthesis associated RND transporter like protein HpnN